jgi:hypothetical protein
MNVADTNAHTTQISTLSPPPPPPSPKKGHFTISSPYKNLAEAQIEVNKNI